MPCWIRMHGHNQDTTSINLYVECLNCHIHASIGCLKSSFYCDLLIGIVFITFYHMHETRFHQPTIHLVPVHNMRRTYGLRLLPCPNALIIEIANFSSFILFSIPNILNYRPTMATVATNENLHMNYDWHKWSKTSMRELLIVIAFLFRLSNICCWTLFFPFLLSFAHCSVV